MIINLCMESIEQGHGHGHFHGRHVVGLLTPAMAQLDQQIHADVAVGIDNIKVMF